MMVYSCSRGFKEQTSIPHTLPTYRVMDVFHAKAEKVENAELGKRGGGSEGEGSRDPRRLCL